MADEPRVGNWELADRARERAERNLVATVKALVQEHYTLYGSWPSDAWLFQQIGLKGSA